MLNNVVIAGNVRSVKPSHISHGTQMYEMKVDVERTSGKIDNVIVYFDDRFNVVDKPYVVVRGTLRETVYGSDTLITVHAYEVYFMDDMHDTLPDEINSVELEGIISFVGTIRYAKGIPFATVIIRSDRDNGYDKDTLATVFWGQYALDVSEDDVGAMVSVTGRVQNKKHGNQISVRRVEWK